MQTTDHPRYLRPGWFTQHVVNRFLGRLARAGVGLKGMRQLAVPRRTSGGWQTLPVNLLEVEGRRYLVAPRGETQWVRNIRVSGGGELRLGRRVEAIRVAELDDGAKPVVLREYLRRWRSEVKVFFDNLDANAPEERLREIAPGSKIVACGQKRSNDMNWSETIIDVAGQSFDILGAHNYEYEPENYATGVRRIEDYLEKLIEYVRRSAHPAIEIAVLEWGSSRTYDWRAGLHAAGSLLSALSRDQIVAFVTTALVAFALVLSGNEDVVAVLDGLSPQLAIGTFLYEWVSVVPHYEAFVAGVIELSGLLYFVSLTALALFACGLVLERNRA